jgi:RNA polymerase sigma factor (sigma-70 family)
MARRQPAVASRQLRTLFDVGVIGGLTDRQLLEQFSTGHREMAEAAFATLVERHGPMVLRVCRGVLGDSHDVHDTFQATFLVLVRKAGSLWVRDSLGPWLHGVALRVATKAKVAAARRKAHERRAAEAAEARRGSEDDKLGTTLHEEVDRLPTKYRAPIVLCYLEGLSHEGAATVLGWPVGTVSGRLARARDLLRARLVRRGLAPSAVTVGGFLSANEASAATPLSESAIRAVLSLVTERSAGVAPAAVVALSKGCLRTMATSRLKTASILLLAGIAALGLSHAALSRLVGDGHHARPASQPAGAGAAEPELDSWPPGVTVSGRLLDHRGEAVAGADVLLLGSEQLTVWADPGQEEGQVRYNLSTRPADPTAAVKTDGRGRFSLRRPGSSADRIVVVCEQMLLWEVTRNEVLDDTDVEIRLPEPVALAIHCDIPEKSANQEFWIVGRMSDRVDRKSDSILYRDIKVPNPGEKILQPLPPGQYAIERINFTPQGSKSNSVSMAMCERRLLAIAAGKRTDVTFDRKTGRRVEGRVRGLEKLKLRYATVTIGYWGPEELFEPGGKKSRMGTHFDVIPIGPDGVFSTPPLPPNRYQFMLWATLAATPEQESHEADWSGQTEVVIPETGEIPKVEIVAKGRVTGAVERVKARDPKQPRLEVRAFDTAGAAIKDFEIQINGPAIGTSSEPPFGTKAAIGVDGLAVLTDSALMGWTYGELIVSAPGYASTINDLGFFDGLKKVDAKLERGLKVRLRVRDADGKSIRPALMPLPQVYLARHRQDAWYTLAYKDPDTRSPAVERTNFLNVRPEAGGDFTFQLASDQTEPLYFGFSHPDVLLYYEKGPVTASDLAGGAWDVVLPRPATALVSLKCPAGADGKPLFASAYYSLTPIFPGPNGPVPGLDSGMIKAAQWRTTLKRLAPRSYNVHIQTQANNGSLGRRDLLARAGEYSDVRKLDLKPGEEVSIGFDPPPFNPDAWRGKLSAIVVISPAGDRPLGGENFRVLYRLPNYGLLPVAKGTLGADGRIAIENLAASGTSDFGGQYWVEVGGERVGHFKVVNQPARQDFRFRMPLGVGDLAAVGEALDLETKRPVKIADFRGRIVFLEFWATWCGPCSEPIRRLADLGKRRSEPWRTDVALVAVGIDNKRERLRKYVLQHGLGTIQQLWSPQDDSDEKANARAAYSITGVPTAFLIGRDGRIVWRGHPASLDVEAKIEALIGGVK